VARPLQGSAASIVLCWQSPVRAMGIVTITGVLACTAPGICSIQSPNMRANAYGRKCRSTEINHWMTKGSSRLPFCLVASDR
jgi:hypothetical protein